MVRTRRALLAVLGVAAISAACTDETRNSITGPPLGPDSLANSVGPAILGAGAAPRFVEPAPSEGPVAEEGKVASGPLMSEAPAVSREDVSATATALLLWQNTNTGDRGFWELNGPYPNSGWKPLTVITPTWNIACTADFNGDGSHDILWNNTSTGDWGFWLLNGTHLDASRGYIPLTTISNDWKVAACADVNGDHKPDLLWRNAGTGDMGWWLMDGTGPSASGYTPLTTIDAVWEVAALRDFSGDGKPDILWQNLTTGDRGFWLLDGKYPSSGWIPLTIIPGNWKIDDAADANGDGSNDILWHNTSTGERGWWYLNGTTVQSGWTPMTTISNEWNVAAILPTGASCDVTGTDTPAVIAMRDASCRLAENLPSGEAQAVVKSKVNPVLQKLLTGQTAEAKTLATQAAEDIAGLDPGAGGLPDRDAIVVALKFVGMLP